MYNFGAQSNYLLLPDMTSKSTSRSRHTNFDTKPYAHIDIILGETEFWFRQKVLTKIILQNWSRQKVSTKSFDKKLFPKISSWVPPGDRLFTHFLLPQIPIFFSVLFTQFQTLQNLFFQISKVSKFIFQKNFFLDHFSTLQWRFTEFRHVVLQHRFLTPTSYFYPLLPSFVFDITWYPTLCNSVFTKRHKTSL